MLAGGAGDGISGSARALPPNPGRVHPQDAAQTPRLPRLWDRQTAVRL